MIKFLRDYKGFSFDIIFVDPPYRIEEERMSSMFSLLGNRERRIISEGSMIIYEYFAKRDITREINKLNIIKSSHFGDKIVSYMRQVNSQT